MKKTALQCVVFLFLISLLTPSAFSAEKLIYSFEEDLDGWAIPDWSRDKVDYATKSVETSKKVASKGKSSLKMNVQFPKDGWYAGVVDVEGPLDWSKYNTVLCDIYAPSKYLERVEARLAINVGKKWLWIEQKKSTKLERGKWTTVRADLTTGNTSWRKTEMVEKKDKEGKIRGYVARYITVELKDSYKEKVQVFTIRIEAVNSPYKGAFYIDNIRLEE
ncbi:MAG: hypothetical protein ISS91_03730 [Candidatus Omnitrophica bacterium]|nr:hypothetical protein [Candidatus Omnitrophota bacterium]